MLSLHKYRPLPARMRRVSVIACDLDGTLLDDQGMIPPAVVESIARLRDAGVEVMLTSGRTDGFIRQYARVVSSPLPIVSLNGALIRGTNSAVIAAELLPLDVGETINRAVSRTANTSLCVFTTDRILGTELPLRIPRYLRAYPAEHRRTEVLSAFFDSSVMFVLHSHFSVIQEVRNRLLRGFPRLVDLTLYPSQQEDNLAYLEIRRAGVSKGTSLEKVAEHLGIGMKRIAAIGDFTNDIDMCRRAGVSAAMVNAVKELKFAVDFVTRKSNNDGGTTEFFRAVATAKRLRI